MADHLLSDKDWNVLDRYYCRHCMTDDHDGDDGGSTRPGNDQPLLREGLTFRSFLINDPRQRTLLNERDIDSFHLQRIPSPWQTSLSAPASKLMDRITSSPKEGKGITKPITWPALFPSGPHRSRVVTSKPHPGTPPLLYFRRFRIRGVLCFFSLVESAHRAGRPQGVTGCDLPMGARPSPPPCGWSTGFITTPRTLGRRPSHRCRPAFPTSRLFASTFPTCPTVAQHSFGINRTSPKEGDCYKITLFGHQLCNSTRRSDESAAEQDEPRCCVFPCLTAY
jgi:hypothetical protein